MSVDLAPACRAASSNLAAALFLLPRHRRKDALIFYRFCRAVDDIADSLTLPAHEKYLSLNAWKRAVSTGCDLPAPLAEVLDRHRIEKRLLLAILEGCASDVEPQTFANLEALEKYCWRVAGAVGLVSIRIFGCQAPASTRYAEDLGRALQLTNILRDVGEDAARGRLYLPLDLLGRCGISKESLLAGHPEPGFLQAAQFLAKEARKRFQQAAPPPLDWHALRPARVMAAIYAHLLRKMEQDDFRVFEKKYCLPAWQKFLIAMRTILSPRPPLSNPGPHRQR